MLSTSYNTAFYTRQNAPIAICVNKLNCNCNSK